MDKKLTNLIEEEIEKLTLQEDLESKETTDNTDEKLDSKSLFISSEND
jgi:hypothetical protein